ncbi:MAG: GxxExxY protein [Vicinamibacterales bacterium]
MSLRVQSPLSDETERIVTEVIDAAVAVHAALGPGLLESIYSDAMSIELAFRDLTCERERAVMLYFRGHPLRVQRLDFVVQGRILLELKAVERLAPVHQAQVLSYLKASGLRVALLINFNCAGLRGQIRRFVL